MPRVAAAVLAEVEATVAMVLRRGGETRMGVHEGVALPIVPTTTGTARAVPRAEVLVGRCFAGNIARRTITGGATGVTTCRVETGNI